MSTNYLNKKFKKVTEPAFTIVEFLVVMAVIAILATIGGTIFYNFRFKLNDVRRVADIRQVASALDRYYFDEGRYPDDLPAGLPIISPSGIIYLSAMPTNPAPSSQSNCPPGGYLYVNMGSSYQLIACLDNPVNDIPAGGIIVGPSTPLGPVSDIVGLVGNWKFDEAAGTTAIDFSGYGNDGTWVGSSPAHYVIGRSGTTAAIFNGTDDYIKIDSSPLLNANSLTIALWIKSAEITGHNYIVEKGSPSQYGISLDQGHNNGELDILLDADQTCGGSNKTYDADTILTTDTWYFVAFTFDDAANTVKIYVNGNLDSTYTYNGCVPMNSGDFLIGRSVGNNQGYEYGGLMDDFRFYNRALSAQEIMSLYNNTK